MFRTVRFKRGCENVVPRARAFNPEAKAAVDQIAAAGISDPSLGSYVKSYGTSDGTPVTPNMHYRIASVTKTFTADGVLHLAQQGKLSLNAHISKYVSGIPIVKQLYPGTTAYWPSK